ncbi:UNVERIFIED_ORG: hypothetical protein B5F06_04260 [Lacrimispora saccharolytica]|nr:hypothetical protein CLOM621_08893 [Clostridium sp. M62/1]
MKRACESEQHISQNGAASGPLFCITGNSEEFPVIQKALPGGMRTPRRGKGCLKQPRGGAKKQASPL